MVRQKGPSSEGLFYLRVAVHAAAGHNKTMKFSSFEEFYPTYLAEHKNCMSRRLHFVGTSFVILCILGVFFTGNWLLLLFAPVLGYGFSWYGHWVCEKNRPLTFRFPLYSLMGDFRMFWEILTGKIKAF